MVEHKHSYMFVGKYFDVLLQWRCLRCGEVQHLFRQFFYEEMLSK